MKEHKHYPVSGCGLVRMWKLRYSYFNFQRLIDWDTRTSRCHECSALIRVPKAFDIVWIFYLVIFIPTSVLCASPIFNLNLPWFLEVIIGVIAAAFFMLLSGALLTSLVMAFGRWEVIEIGEQDVEDVKQQLRKEEQMEEHKHYPVSGCRLVRVWKLLFYFFRFRPRLIDWDTRTSRCHECSALIRVPKAYDIVGLFYPLISIPPALLCCILIDNLNLPESLRRAIGAMIFGFVMLLSEALLTSLVMAFGRWELVEIGEQDIEDVKQQLRKEVRLAKKKSSYKWLMVGAIIITMLTIAGTVLLMLAITSS